MSALHFGELASAVDLSHQFIQHICGRSCYCLRRCKIAGSIAASSDQAFALDEVLRFIKCYIEDAYDRIQNAPKLAIVNAPAVQRAVVPGNAQGGIRVAPIDNERATPVCKSPNEPNRSRHG